MRWMTAKEASEVVPFSEITLKRCMKRAKPVEGELPPLRAKKDPQGRWIVTDKALEDWMNQVLTQK